jgi:hypothetical protein
MKNNSTIPPRTYKVNELVKSIATCALDVNEESKTDPEIANPILAFCEIAVSLPIEWFTNDERTMIVSLIDTLYGRGFLTFMHDIVVGDISFYNKMVAETGLGDHPHADLKLVVTKMKAMHDHQFGGNK